MSQIEQQIEQLAQERGYANIAEMRENMGERGYARLVQNIMPMAKAGVPFEVYKNSANLTAKTIRVYLNQDPSVFVEVNTTEDRVRAKLQGIRKDIANQKFARWAPFAGQSQCGNKQDPNAKGWAWTFVEGNE